MSSVRKTGATRGSDAGGAERDESEAERHESAEPARDDSQEEERRFLVAGIGASAGGLEALGELIRHVPVDRMAFIVVQHLAPDHESVLTQLLAPNTSLEVVTAADGMSVEINHIYVIPPNADLAVMHGVIRLITPPSQRVPHLSVDYLFRSLAEDLGQSAVGIVLSGTGTDGTLGLEAIKAAGGFTFVQDPSSAKYDGMPRSALASGAADYCLPPRGIGEELERITKQPGLRLGPPTPAPPVHVQNQLGKLFVLVRSAFGNDLTHYKEATIERRIERRMMLHRIERLEDYVKYVQSNPDELRAFYRDTLITVTSFFRDPGAFEALASKVLPRIVERKEPGQPIRVWVPGCATGEEAYSIAMCLFELCEQTNRDAKIQIFGTDIDEDCIQHARRGIYPANIAADVSPERLHRFFTRKEDEYQISRRIRDMLIFSRQNVLKDAPFSRIDLVSCRNLLIYLQPASQKNVLRIFHYALEPSGYLLLGSSETVGDAQDLFSPVDRKHKIYTRKQVVLPGGPGMAFGVRIPLESPRPPLRARSMLSVQGLADRKVLELYGPPGVIINEDLEILQFRGRTGPYLDPAPGVASLNVLKVARMELHIELERAIRHAFARQQRVTSEVMYLDEGKHCVVRLDVVPLHDDAETRVRNLLVLFHRMPPPKEVAVVSPEAGDTGQGVGPLVQRMQALERELAVTKEYLRTTIEERESTLEELQSANEELQSSNEELQSTNEELETSKEEMQSTNEELTTVNEELYSRMAELSQTNDDLYNVLAGVDNAVIIVGMDMKIRRYTAAAERLFKLVPGDIGRSIGFLDPFLGSGALERKVSTVIQDLSALEEEVLASNQRWYALEINPYKTLDHSIRGALIKLVDIDVRKRAQEMTRDVGAYAERFLAPIGHPLLIVDRKMRVVWCNEAFLSSFQLTADETVGNVLANVGARQFADKGLRERLDTVFGSATVFRDYEMRFRLLGGGERSVKVAGSQVPASQETPLALLSMEPLSEVSSRGPS